MQFEVAIERWARVVPLHLQEAFRTEFRFFGARYESALDTLEGIWERREHAYAFDESTGLATRSSFRDYLTTLLGKVPSGDLTAIGVLFIDVNNLKRINDTAGHEAGDRAIAAVGAIVREALRDGHADRVARVGEDERAVGRHGGDEFVAALQLADSVEIDKVARRIKCRADDHDQQYSHGYTAFTELSVSVGGIVYALPPEPPALAFNVLANTLISAADQLMYGSKRDGLVHVARAQFTDRLEFEAERTLAAVVS